jgi:uncharacterized membrane protein (DUF485 family)
MINSFAIIAFAALIHASFQLSVSVLTLLSGHAIGAKTAHAKLLRLTNAFSFGVAIMTMLILCFFAYILQHSFGTTVPAVAWASGSGLVIGLGVAVWVFYYRRSPGTSLWIPRSMARYLSDRTKQTKHSTEAFGLGLSSVVGELIFILAPMIISAFVLIQLSAGWQLLGILLYVFISLLPLLIVNGLIGSGHRLSNIQRWRENNKRFLQFAAGSGLLILGCYLYVDKVVAISISIQGAF